MKRPETRRPWIEGEVLVLPLTRGLVAIVDASCAPVIGDRPWYADCGSAGYIYARQRSGRKQIYLHRLLASAKDGECVDHINGDTLDNRLENLRVVTLAQNNINRAVGSNNRSGVKGVSWVTSRGRWLANITINKRSQTIGWFVRKEDAVAARLEAEARLHGQFARAYS